MTRIFRGFVIAFALVAIVAGAGAAWARKPPGGPGSCECAPIDAPVLCSNGITYLSACVAACAGQTNCVPTGGGGPN